MEGNRMGALPGSAFHELRVVRLMLRENELQRLSATALSGQEDTLTELFVVEPELTHFAPELLRPFRKLQAITLQAPNLRRLPRVEGLSALRYLRMEATERAAWRGVMLQGLPSLEQLHLSCIERGSGLDKLDAGMLQDTPRLDTFSLTECSISWIHPHALASAARSLVSLDLSNNLLDDVGQTMLSFRDLAILSELRLENNEFRSLPEGSLVSLPALRSLSLAGNHITEVARNAFHMLPSLEQLDLSKNAIKRLHPQAFTPRAVPRLQELNLAHNYLGHVAEIRPWMNELPTLRRLDLSDNRLEELGWAALGPAGHSALERLSLDHNRLRVVRRDALSALPALIELHMRNNSLDERSLLDGGSPWNLPGLKGLDLGQNLVRSLDARMLAGLPSLRHLDLSENRLSVLHGSPFSPAPMLEHVNLSDNALEALPVAAIGPLRALYELDLARNSLISLPMDPGRSLDGLGVLNVEGNQLGSLPESWTSGQSTQTLQLSGNALRALPRLNLKGLTRLDVSRNLLSRLDMDTLGSARELTFLNASNNELSHFPEGVRGLSGLRDLDLSGNRMNTLPEPGVLASLHSLRSLRLARNQLTSLGSGAVQGLPRLTALSLADNRLAALAPGALSNLPALAELDLARNAIEALPMSSFARLPALRAASLQGNRLKEFDANVFDGAPRLLLLDLSHNELRHLNWGRPAWGNPWGGRDEPSATGDRAEARSPQPARISRGFKGISRALEAGPDERDLVHASPAMPGLEVLDLSHNQLQNLEDAGVSGLPWLVELKVDNNDICGLRARTLSGLSRLRVLSMRNNRVSMLQERAFRSLRSNMVHLDVAGNPLSCSCGLLWLQAWMEEEPSLQPGGPGATKNEAAPRCADGSLLREVELSRSHCLDQQRDLLDEERQEEEIMQQCSGFRGASPHGNEATYNNVAPSPEDSLYFEEQFVDYPQGPEIIANQTASMSTTTSAPMPPPPPPPQVTHHVVPSPAPPAATDHSSGDTPTLYAGSIRPPQNTPPVGIVSESPFTLFGYPIPSITSLLNPSSVSRSSSGKKIEAQAENAQGISNVTPYEDGFLPSLGPPRVRPPWVIGPSGSSSNSTTSHVQSVSRMEAISDKKKQVFTATHQQSNVLTPTKNPLKFPYSHPGSVVRQGNGMPIDHRGSLPIRDDGSWKLPDNVETTTKPEWIDEKTTTVKPAINPTLQPKFKFEHVTEDPRENDTDYQYFDRGVMYEKGVIPLVFSEETKDTSTTRYINEPTSTEHQITTMDWTTTTVAPTVRTRLHRYETTSISPETTQSPTMTNLQLLVPHSNTVQNKATITKVESAPQPHHHFPHPHPADNFHGNFPQSGGKQSTVSPPASTTDQQGQGTWWYYRDYNRTNLEPFRGEYLLEDEPSAYSAAPSLRKLLVTSLIPAFLFLLFI
ncbi:hypothetical protein B566_EDAN017316 [Ephemera danica]|nr:hypothetical protein B566_EDAN017316 [Ephemera danica]